MNRVGVIWWKELVDTLRDRRTLLTMIVGPALVMPLLMLLPQYVVSRQVEVQRQVDLRVAVAGAEHAPGLVAFLRSQGVDVVPHQDPGQPVREHELPVGLVIDAGFDASVAAGQPARLTVLTDASRLASAQQAERLEALLTAYGRTVVADRLVARGIDPSIVDAFAVEVQNLATREQMGGAVLSLLLPLFMMLWAVLGGMYAAIDATAGEKERQTLEPLLHAPVSRLQVVLGKLLAVASASTFAVVLALGGTVAGFVLAEPLFEGSGTAVAFHLPPRTMLLVLVTLLPVVIMFAALELAVGLYARSFKEAQNYIAVLQLVVMIPAMAVSAAPELAPPLRALALPLFGPMVALKHAVAGTGTAAQFAVMVTSSLAYAALSVGLATRFFRSERVIFRT